MSTELWIREWSVRVGDVLIRPGLDGSELTVRFEVQKSTAREPNTCSVRIFNLAPQRRRALEQLEDPQIEIRAGYLDLVDTIFTGDARYIQSGRDNTEVATEIEAEDGGRSYRTAYIHRSYPPDVSLQTVIGALAEALGVGRGNASQVAAIAELDSGGSVYPTGTVLDGLAWRELDRVCRSASLRWSVQSGVLQLRRAGLPSEPGALALEAGAGLIGSPSRGKPDERTGRSTVSAKAHLIPGMRPGRVIRLRSSEINGGFQCKRVRFQGDSTGQDWYADLELEDY